MTKKFKKEDHEKLVELFKERYPECIVEKTEFNDKFHLKKDQKAVLSEEYKIKITKLRLKKE